MTFKFYKYHLGKSIVAKFLIEIHSLDSIPTPQSNTVVVTEISIQTLHKLIYVAS